MNKEQHELLGEAYRNYGFTCIGETKRQEQQMKEKGGWLDLCLTPYFEDKEEFINKCKTDTEFSENWELKIEERELSLEERVDYKKKRDGIARTFAPYTHQMLDNANIPTKLITITYNDKTIESYE
jgi:CRISPR/Cas system CMR-associated protein Cmr3 (group 5 of RAMP superfamily)